MKRLTRIVLLLIAFTAESSVPFDARAGAAVRMQTIPIAQELSLPLGYRDGKSYGPRINYQGDLLIEDSEYGVKNPDMQGITCFELDWWKLYHAGEDLYRMDGKSTANAEVTAVADGQVRYIAYNFPGAVLILKHFLAPDGKRMFSLYGHLDPNSVQVSENQIVSRGQKLGTVLLQYYDGRYTDNHDDSHLHFEMRDFFDGSALYDNYPYCNGYIPGRGYTYPMIPDVFPSETNHYTDPVALILRRPQAYLPMIVQP
jgi:murein DD-endopeptidase MepM/ murein hydrolase activator NlpD